MKGQKGQDIVEFALLFPVFMIIITGIIYVGLLFGDYVSLNNQARSIARDAAVVGHYTTTTDNGQTNTVDNYAKLKSDFIDTIQKDGIVTTLYSFKSLDIKDPKEHSGEGPDNSVQVILTMSLNKDAALGKLADLLGIPKIFGDKLQFIYYMHDETVSSN